MPSLSYCVLGMKRSLDKMSCFIVCTQVFKIFLIRSNSLGPSQTPFTEPMGYGLMLSVSEERDTVSLVSVSPASITVSDIQYGLNKCLFNQ